MGDKDRNIQCTADTTMTVITYIEGFHDMKKLLDARGFKEIEPDFFDADDYFTEWARTVNRKKHVLKISDVLFDEDKKLKFIKRTDWREEYVQLKETEEPLDDDLPF